MSLTCQEKQKQIKALFATCETEDDKYKKIILLGRENPPLAPEHKNPENRVEGCQSTLYLHAFMDGEAVHFQAESDALISSGLAVLLISVYSGETPETLLKCPPKYLEDLGIQASLTPNRANGLYSIHKRMQQDALMFLVQQKTLE